MCAKAASPGLADEESLRLCSQAIEQSGLNQHDLVATYVNRGSVSMNRRDYASARADFEHAISMDPTVGEAWLDRGAIDIAEHRYRDGIADTTKGIELGVRSRPRLTSIARSPTRASTTSRTPTSTTRRRWCCSPPGTRPSTSCCASPSCGEGRRGRRSSVVSHAYRLGASPIQAHKGSATSHEEPGGNVMTEQISRRGVIAASLAAGALGAASAAPGPGRAAGRGSGHSLSRRARSSSTRDHQRQGAGHRQRRHQGCSAAFPMARPTGGKTASCRRRSRRRGRACATASATADLAADPSPTCAATTPDDHVGPPHRLRRHGRGLPLPERLDAGRERQRQARR